MTKMSDLHVDVGLAPHRNLAKSWRGSRLARAVHDGRVLVGILAALLLIGCVIPPAIELEAQDAGTNSPPAILSVASDQQVLPEPGPVSFNQGRTAGSLNVSLIDTDLRDTLYVRIFVDYNLPNRLDARVRCQAPPSMNAMRSTTCILSTLCTDDDIGVQRHMTIVVFDRPLLENGEDPPFQAMQPGGLTTSRSYFLNCLPPSA
jgi:hypothetical protein